MKYQFFGDIHGETLWDEILKQECIPVFLGDYFSPYKEFSFKQCMDNFLKIVQLKKDNPETILLIGNHDVDHWYIQEHYSRFDALHLREIYDAFEENKECFQIAFAKGDYLVSHAGVTKEWLNLRLPETRIDPQTIATAINKLWLDENYSAFNFRDNASFWDYCGTSEMQGPLWIRWNTLIYHNVFEGTPYKQIVGHTIDKDFRYSPNQEDWNLVCLDCLAFQPKSLVLDI